MCEINDIPWNSQSVCRVTMDKPHYQCGMVFDKRSIDNIRMQSFYEFNTEHKHEFSIEISKVMNSDAKRMSQCLFRQKF